MSVYTVHEPPLRAADSLPDPQRFIFVRDGFYVWAFLLTPLWLLWRRLWLVLLLYLVVTFGAEAGVRYLGASLPVVALVGILVSLLVGFEAGSLWRFTLRRRRWRNVGVVSGDNVEDAELRFFDAWVRQAPPRNGAGPNVRPPPSAASAAGPSPAPEASGIVGLFPEPGAPR